MTGGIAWYDLNRDGRRLESIIKQVRTRMDKEDIEPSMYLAYLDRLLKATNTKVNIAETVLNVKAFLAQATKEYGKLPSAPGVIEVRS